MKRFALSLIAAGVAALGLVVLTAVQADASPVPEVAVEAAVAVSEAAPQAAIPNVTFVPAHTTSYFPPHEHVACAYNAGTHYQCQRWILANGAIIFGPYYLMIQQYNYVLVWCAYSDANVHWSKNGAAFGPWGNNGDHTYCRHPMSTYTHWRFGYGTWPWSWRTG
jgi:hypothetical protein